MSKPASAPAVYSGWWGKQPPGSMSAAFSRLSNSCPRLSHVKWRCPITRWLIVKSRLCCEEMQFSNQTPMAWFRVFMRRFEGNSAFPVGRQRFNGDKGESGVAT